ncbi:hypothetical protein HanIR_Chr02g0054121 [Helianthus annuus]|uniref:leucine-rich repeat extensin-like protein 1 n=1 Tax=Helianthus annuus TaxID=4232 RepID=UPI000B8F5461|nr:leucine-rich repeat extensin-like protein 1 [Helianthus annuus]KAJ0613679.1 hypothetical protein HanIR_Chr02g0054121 [Helianthus annuus]
MVKLQTFMTLLTFLLLSSTATATTRHATLGRRGLATYCDPVFGTCTQYQWPFSPIISNHHYIPRSFIRHQSPPLLAGSLPPVVVPSPPPVFTNPSFTPSSGYANPTFSPLVASPPPPGNTIPSVFPELPPNGGYITYSPPVGGNLPPIMGKNQPGVVFMSPPQQRWSAPAGADLPPIVGELPQQRPEDVVMPPPVGGNARMKVKPQLPPVVQSPPAA